MDEVQPDNETNSSGGQFSLLLSCYLIEVGIPQTGVWNLWTMTMAKYWKVFTNYSLCII